MKMEKIFEEIFFDVRALTSNNLFNIKEIIDAINGLLNDYGVNRQAYMSRPSKWTDFDEGKVMIGHIFAGEEEYTFPFYKTGDAAVFLKDTGMSPATTIAKGNHLEILSKFFDLVGSKLRVNIERRIKMGGIFCKAPIICEQGNSLGDCAALLRAFEHF